MSVYSDHAYAHRPVLLLDPNVRGITQAPPKSRIHQIHRRPLPSRFVFVFLKLAMT